MSWQIIYKKVASEIVVLGIIHGSRRGIASSLPLRSNEDEGGELISFASSLPLRSNEDEWGLIPKKG